MQRQPAGDEPRALSTGRAMWMLVGVGLLWWAWQLIGAARYTWTVPFLVVCNIVGVLVVLGALLPDGLWVSDSRFIRGLEWAAVSLTAAVFVAWGISATGGMSPYGTDAMAFNQYAAQLAEHGLNPYVHSMQPAFGLFRTPTAFYTYAFNGRPVTALSYPSMSFLVYVPFLALGWSQNLAPLLNVFAWAITMLMMFAMVPRDLRAPAILLGGFSLYAVFSIGGVTDVLFMPLMLGAAYRWDRFGSSRATYLGPICFGLAMGIKQNPWTALPFLLLALCLDEQSRTSLRAGLMRSGRYLAAVLVAFAIPNLPYFIASPSAWIHGVLTPIFANMVPTGQGTISLSLYLHMGGGSMMAYTAAAALMLVLLLVAFIGTYPLLRAGAFILPALAFLFDDRSNVNYFVSLIPVGFVAAATVRQAPMRAAGAVSFAVSRGRDLRHLARRALSTTRLFRSARWATATGALAVLFVLAAGYSLAAPAPLRIRVVGVVTTGTQSRVVELKLRVTNLTGHAVQPAFDVIRGGYNSTFWKRQSGPGTLPAGASGTYRLTARNFDAEPSLFGGFNVAGYVRSPKSFAVSPVYLPKLYNLAFVPDSIDRTIPLRQPVKVTVQLFSTTGAQLHRAGVLVRLSQIVWAASGPQQGYALINRAPKGLSGYSYTDAHGVATFRVRSKVLSPYPDTFSAAVFNVRDGYVYSDSGNLSIWFGRR